MQGVFRACANRHGSEALETSKSFFVGSSGSFPGPHGAYWRML